MCDFSGYDQTSLFTAEFGYSDLLDDKNDPIQVFKDYIVSDLSDCKNTHFLDRT